MHAPTPLKYDPEDPLHLNFVVSAAHLRAFTLGIIDSKDGTERICLLLGELKSSDIKEWEEKVQYIKELTSKMELRAWAPKGKPPELKALHYRS